MKIVKIGINDKYLSEEESRKVSLLKIAEPKKYVEGIGVYDGEFFIITETEVDDMYLSWLHNNGAQYNEEGFKNDFRAIHVDIEMAKIKARRLEREKPSE